MSRRKQHQSAADLFEKAAAPIYRFVALLEDGALVGEDALAARAENELASFAEVLALSDVPDPAVTPARFALAVLIDARARAQPHLKLAKWGALAQARLFDGRDMSLGQVQEFAETARRAGPEYSGLADFLNGVVQKTRAGGRNLTRDRSSWGLFAVLSVAVFLVALAGYASWLEHRFHAKIIERFQHEIQSITIETDASDPDIASALSDLADARDRVSRAVQFAPFRRVFRLPLVDSETKADAVYLGAVATFGPPVLARALEEVLATEGDSLKLYDALRAFVVLSGDVAWSPDYLAGWLEDYQSSLGLTGLARHAPVFPPPDGQIKISDTLVFDQARLFAAETSEADRVWLELLRASETRALPAWYPELEVPGLSDILVLRSGVPLNTPVQGLFTQSGWAYARDFGTGVAVQSARSLAPIVLGRTPDPVNQTPDLVQAKLHRQTLDVWTRWLAELRVEPFDDPDRALHVSGILAQSSNPLTRVLREVWTQMGGTDRGREFAQQVELGRIFGPVIQYVDEGGMERLGRLFSTLNVALSKQERGAEQLVSLQERAQTIQVLQTAPRFIVQIAEDVLAQANAATAQTGADPLILRWQRVVYPACRATLEGRYPFADGPDAAPDDVTSLLAPSGSLMQFFNSYLAKYLDTSVRPWRWKPEARFAGLDPASAAFFERAVIVSEALFDDQNQLRLNVSLAALAERGTTLVALGGQGAPVRAAGEPATLSWPGPAPLLGATVSFREGAGTADLSAPGYWGLMRLLDRFRLRFRDEGARLLVDLRSPEGRAFVEMGFPSARNPIAARSLMQGFSCPPRL